MSNVGSVAQQRRERLPPHGSRRPQAIDTGMSHVGFRCVQRPVPMDPDGDQRD